MDIVIAAVGLYMAFQAFGMKADGKISSLVATEEEVKHCKNPAGYIKAVFPYMLFFAVIAFVAGVIGVLCDLKVITVGKIWTYVELLLFLLALCIFAAGMRKARDDFLVKCNGNL